MNQKLSLSLFFSGLPMFLLSLGEFFTEHSSWSDMTTPVAAGHIIIMTASFISTVVGAVGIQLPRSTTGHGDRASDSNKENQ